MSTENEEYDENIWPHLAPVEARLMKDRRGNGVRPLCCGREPMLRVWLGLPHAEPETFVEYVCRSCEHRGGLSKNKREARISWRERTKGPLTQ